MFKSALHPRYRVEIVDCKTDFEHMLSKKVHTLALNWYVEYFPKLPILRKLEAMYSSGNLRVEQFADKLKRYYRKLFEVYPVSKVRNEN